MVPSIHEHEIGLWSWYLQFQSMRLVSGHGPDAVAAMQMYPQSAADWNTSAEQYI
jgi:hypothetical protein